MSGEHQCTIKTGESETKTLVGLAKSRVHKVFMFSNGENNNQKPHGTERPDWPFPGYFRFKWKMVRDKAARAGEQICAFWLRPELQTVERLWPERKQVIARIPRATEWTKQKALNGVESRVDID